MQDFAIKRKKQAWSLLKKSIFPRLFAVFFGLLPLLTVPFLAQGALYTKSLLLVFVSLLVLLTFFFTVLRKQVQKVTIPTSVFLLWVLFSTALVYSYSANAQFDAYLTSSFGSEGVIMLGVLALLATVPLLTMQKKEHIRLFLQVLCGSVIVLGLIGVLARVNIIPVDTVAVLINDFIPAAAALLICVCLWARTVELRTRDSIFFMFVCAGALSILILGDTPRFIWGTVATFVGVLLVSELFSTLRALRFKSVAASLLKRRTQTIKVLLLFAAVTVISLVSFAMPEKIAPYALQKADSVQTSLTLGTSKELIATSFRQHLYFGTGFGTIQSFWYDYTITNDDNENKIQPFSSDITALSSFLLTYALQFGIVGIFLLLIFLISFFSTGVRALYFPLRYEREVYTYMRVIFIAGALLWIFALSVPAAQSSLYLAAFMTGIMVALSQKLHASQLFQVTIVANGKHRFGTYVLSLFFILASIGGIYAVWLHCNATWLVASAETAETVGKAQPSLSLEERLARVNSAYASVPHSDFLRAKSSLEIALYREYIGSATEDTSSEDVLSRTKHVASVVASAQARLPYDAQMQQSALSLFTSLAQMGVEGAAGRTADIYGALAPLVPERKIEYRFQQAQSLAEDKQYDKALEVVDTYLAGETSPALLSLKSYLYAALGDYAEAVQQLRAYIDAAGESFETSLALGVYVGHAEGVASSLPIFEQLRVKAPTHPYPYIYLAVAYTVLKNPNSALYILNLGIEQATNKEHLVNLLDEINRSGTITSITVWKVGTDAPPIPPTTSSP